jgi:Secretion system C-terminal sorting domain
MKKTITILLMSAICLVSKTNAQNFGTDVIVQNQSIYKQIEPKIASAFNGWLYAAYRFTNVSNDSNGIYFKYSKNNGLTWQKIDSYQEANTSSTFDDLEIEVAGTDTNNLSLYILGLRHNINPSQYLFYIDKYNARNGSFLGPVINYNTGNRQIYDVDMATDYQSPAVGANPYSIGLVYSVFSSLKDSVNYLASVDGGTSFTIRQAIANTGFYNRKVSISYGKSSNGSNGRYFVAWEQLPSSSSRNGSIYFSRSANTVSSVFIAPKNLDSLSTSVAGICRNPKISTSFGLFNNDSANTTAIVTFERDYQGLGNDYDIIGFVNSKASATTSYLSWYRFDILNTGNLEKQPSVAFEDSAKTFNVSVYDSTNGQLQVYKHSFNFTLANLDNWDTVRLGYNDVNPGGEPWADIAINPKKKKVAAVWSSQTGSANPKVLFDAEYNTISSSLVTEKPKAFGISIHPNPAKDFINVKLDLKQASQVSMELIDMTGKIIMKNDYGARSGEQNFRFDFSDLKTGIYMMQLKTDKETAGYKISVEK